MPGPKNEDHAVRTLIVDDDPDMARLVQARLRAVGILADATESPEDAVSIIVNSSYCVVVCDIDMPVMDGIELAGRIKSFDPVIQIVMLTAEPTFARAVAALDRGAFDLLSKLHDLQRLAEVVAGALERASRWRRLADGGPSIDLDPLHTFNARDSFDRLSAGLF